MKVAVFGGGGLRTPLLLSALDRSGPGFREAALYDPDGDRLAALLPVLRAAAPGLAVTRAGSPAEAARGSRFVVLAIRVGGQEARAADERACLEAGAVGQETVGAAGAALAFRNLPAALDLARTVEREAPDALVVNYANPAGMVTEALANHSGARVVGVCDTPAALADRVAGLVGAAPGRYSVSWSGVNHCGWLTRLYRPVERAPRPPLLDARMRSPRSVSRRDALPTDRRRESLRDSPRHLSRGGGHPLPAPLPGRRFAPTGVSRTSSTGCALPDGRAPSPDDPPLPPEDLLAGLFGAPERLRSAHPPGLFEAEEFRGAVPSEYVYFALHPDRAVERARAAGTTRGRQVLELEARLFAALRAPAGASAGTDEEAGLRVYREVLAEREATYFGIEAGRGSTGAGTAGGAAKPGPGGGAGLAPSGYDRIGLAVIRAALAAEDGSGGGGRDSAAEIVLNTRNRTADGGPAVPELPVEDFVEAPARMGSNGAVPSPQPPLPVEAGRLLRRVKSCEREITAAAVAGNAARAAEALREHPAGGPAAAEVFSSLRLR